MAHTGGHKTFVPVYQPGNQNELARIKMLLERENITYYVNNENYSALVPLIATGARTMTVLVEAEKAEEALNLFWNELVGMHKQ